MIHAVLLSVMALVGSDAWLTTTLEGTYSRPLLDKFQRLAQRALEAADDPLKLPGLVVPGAEQANNG